MPDSGVLKPCSNFIRAAHHSISHRIMANSTKDSKAFQAYARVFSPGKSYSMEVDEVYKPNNLRDIKSRVEPLAGAQTVTEWAKGAKDGRSDAQLHSAAVATNDQAIDHATNGLEINSHSENTAGIGISKQEVPRQLQEGATLPLQYAKSIGSEEQG
ncbi:hypothetical protein FLAG1_11569 [Fusarium langsethiae]|uniref:Uncharacterized protein n=1 Tax=Fusarium langsethiae TaxID=179993 RepID=A0A0N0DAR5_FUSLA|nr:hypothetical protein FLAG1_11569 [Fusarium langsethiae]